MLTAAHLAKGDNLRTVRPEYRDSAAAAIRLLQQIEYDEAYWNRMDGEHYVAPAKKADPNKAFAKSHEVAGDDDKPRR